MSRHDISQMLSMGVKDYQLKPINSRLVLALLKRILHKDHLKRYEVDSSDVAVAEVSITFTKISETSLVAESPVKLTDDEDGHYRIKSDDLESRGGLDECLSLSKNTTFASGDGLFRAYFRMRGLKEAVLQKIRSGRF